MYCFPCTVDSDTTSAGLVNVSKLTLTGSVLDEIRLYQSVGYGAVVARVPAVEAWLRMVRALPEDDLYRLSKIREPR